MFEALESHRERLTKRRGRIEVLLSTIDKTINQLNDKTMLKPEELYEGLPKEIGTTYRDEAMKKYGSEKIYHAEKSLSKMNKEDFEKLKSDAKAVSAELFTLMSEEYTNDRVQTLIANHYQIIRMFWGTVDEPDKQAEAYKGLGQLYVSDELFTMQQGQPQPAFALFLSKAMAHFADTQLK
jgi:hypothetical protein